MTADSENLLSSPSLLKSIIGDVVETTTEKRKRALSELEMLIQQLAQDIGIELVVRPFGSYAMGAYSEGSDIDVVIVGPLHISREYIFDKVQAVLSKNGALQIQCVLDAFVPILSFVFCDTEFDMLYAKLPCVGDFVNVINSAEAPKTDKKSTLSLNGLRNDVALRRLIPNMEVFRVVVVLVKKWAKCRLLYSNVFGYLGGISWTILVVKVCMLVPNASPYALFCAFFNFYSNWNESQPITLDNKIAPEKKSPLQIITPASPQINSCYNVTETVRVLIFSEIKRTNCILMEKYRVDVLRTESSLPSLISPYVPSDTTSHPAYLGPSARYAASESLVMDRKVITDDEKLHRVFESKSFFDTYTRFIEVALVPDQESRESKLSDISLLKSKVRHLTTAFASQRNVDCLLYPHCLQDREKTVWFLYAALIVDLSAAAQKKMTLDFTSCVNKFKTSLPSLNHRLQFRYHTRKKLPLHCPRDPLSNRASKNQASRNHTSITAGTSSNNRGQRNTRNASKNRKLNHTENVVEEQRSRVLQSARRHRTATNCKSSDHVSTADNKKYLSSPRPTILNPPVPQRREVRHKSTSTGRTNQTLFCVNIRNVCDQRQANYNYSKPPDSGATPSVVLKKRKIAILLSSTKQVKRRTEKMSGASRQSGQRRCESMTTYEPLRSGGTQSCGRRSTYPTDHRTTTKTAVRMMRSGTTLQNTTVNRYYGPSDHLRS